MELIDFAHKEMFNRLNGSVDVLGIRIDNVSMEEAISQIELMIHSQRNHYVVPVNPEMIVAAQTNVQFREALNNASLALPDGIGTVLASRFMGKPLKERVTGIDTVKRLAAVAHFKGLRLFFLGAAPGVAEQAAQRLKTLYSKLEIVGTYSGSPDPTEEEEICNRIAVAKPHILFVAYGAPQQELWVARNLQRLKAPVVMCVGGTFDYIAGVVVRAPIWIQTLGFEWFHRLIQQPHRFQRMLALPRFTIAFILQLLKTFAD
ncbi:MAG: WecB/TagA/CpsF family glycosyltransferase [Ignavibacteriae bacterium]|nr:WecB/TagA/CpsF family glycosyltransferase [Ignavibacteriota bacterium]